MTFKQETPYSCAASAVRNIIESFGGVVPSEKYVRRICGTKIQGTDEKGLVRGLTKLAYHSEEFYTENETTFKNKLIKILKDGRKAISIIQGSSHWVAITGYANKKIVFCDSDFKKAEQHFTVKEFLLISKNIDKLNKKQFYYMIIVSNIFG